MERSALLRVVQEYCDRRIASEYFANTARLGENPEIREHARERYLAEAALRDKAYLALLTAVEERLEDADR